MADFSFAPNHDHMSEAERAHPTFGTYCSFDVVKSDTGYGGTITGFVGEQVRDLLLAAPDLLDVLKAFPGFTDDATVGDPWIERKNAAIAKAEGRS